MGFVGAEGGDSQENVGRGGVRVSGGGLSSAFYFSSVGWLVFGQMDGIRDKGENVGTLTLGHLLSLVSYDFCRFLFGGKGKRHDSLLWNGIILISLVK